MKKFTGTLLSVLAVVFITCKNKDTTTDGKVVDTNEPVPPSLLSYSIISPAFPHDTSSFTQGLTFYKGELYEGTGYNGKSKLMKVDLKTGKAIKSIPLPYKYFGEGVAILKDTIYQLTWQQNVVFAYAIKGKDFEKVKEFPLATEGWGITTDGKSLIVSTGGNNLDYFDQSTKK